VPLFFSLLARKPRPTHGHPEEQGFVAPPPAPPPAPPRPRATGEGAQ
jgi:hypothetical protein